VTSSSSAILHIASCAWRRDACASKTPRASRPPFHSGSVKPRHVPMSSALRSRACVPPSKRCCRKSQPRRWLPLSMRSKRAMRYRDPPRTSWWNISAPRRPCSANYPRSTRWCSSDSSTSRAASSSSSTRHSARASTARSASACARNSAAPSISNCRRPPPRMPSCCRWVKRTASSWRAWRVSSTARPWKTRSFRRCWIPRCSRPGGAGTRASRWQSGAVRGASARRRRFSAWRPKISSPWSSRTRLPAPRI